MMRCFRISVSGCVAGLQAGVFSDAHDCSGPAIARGLVVEQNAHAAEIPLAGVDERDLVRACVILLLEVELDLDRS